MAMDTEPALLPAHTTATVGELIAVAAARLADAGLAFGHGTDNENDEAAWLIAHALGRSPLEVPDLQQSVSPEDRRAASAVIGERIRTRKPAAYLTGSTWFAGHEFLCDERALVPRSPFAEFINSDFFGVLDGIAEPRILDLCTGGGCIAIAAALARSDARVHASDLSADALALAAENRARHKLEDRVQLHQGSLFEPVEGRFDLILSNPPYVDAADLGAMPAEFHAEPSLGLAAGEDGLDLVAPMLAAAPAYLNEGAWIVIEVGNSAPAVAARWPQLPVTWLEFAGGGSGVFALQREDLTAVAGSAG